MIARLIRSPACTLAGILLLTAVVYWPGLHGPFLFDDASNFDILKPWLAHQIGWRQVVFGVDSGPGGRPLSFLSFMLSAWLGGGITPFAFKFGSLLVHLINGLLVYALARKLAPRDPQYARHAQTAALAITTAWLLHPLLVSTVLYAVQRMAMLSATFTLFGLLAFCRGRESIDAGKPRTGAAWLLLVVPLCTLLAAAAKENGLLLPWLCAVIELFYFCTSGRRSLVVRAFLLFGVALPIAASLLVLIFKPGIVLGGFQGRPFTLTERLLTESRILWDYIGNLLIPWGPGLTLYRDDYILSTSPLAPVTTLLALCGWAAVLVLAWRTRRSMPALGAGLWFFLVGHVMESSIIPLLLYFEHRNYLPSLGILWAIGAVFIAMASTLAPRMHHPGKVFRAGVCLLLLVLATATAARAWVWGNETALFASSLAAHPDSRWLRMDLALHALKRNPIDVATARANYAALQAMPDPVSRQIGAQGQVVLDCGIDAKVSATRAQSIFTASGQQIEADQVQMLELLGGLLLRQPCSGLPTDEFAGALAHWLDLSPMPEGQRIKKNLRFLSARLFITAGMPRQALAQATIDWTHGAKELPVAALVIQLDMALGRTDKARLLLNEVDPMIAPGDKRGMEVFQELRQSLNRCMARSHIQGVPCPPS